MNKRTILILSTSLFFFIMGAFNFVSSMGEIFFLRGIHGIIFALATTVVSTLTVIVLPKHRKGEGINMFAVFSNIAMVLGPAIGLLALDQYGTNTLFMVVTGMTFFAMIVAKLDISVGIGSAVLAVAAHVLGFQDTYKIIAGIVIVALALYHFFY